MTDDPFNAIARRKYGDLNALYDLLDVESEEKGDKAQIQRQMRGKVTLSHILMLRKALRLDAAAEPAPQRIGADQLQAMIAEVMQDD